MFDPDLIDLLPEDQQRIVKTAIISLMASGLIDQQLQRMVDRIREGDFEEDDAKLTYRIKEFRWQASGLRSLKMFAESTLEEMKDA